MSTLKNTTAVLLLSTAFSAAVPAATPDATQGPTGASDFFDLKRAGNDLAKFERDIASKIGTQQTLGKPTDTPEIRDMQQNFAKKAEELFPKIVLTTSISEQDAAALADMLIAKLPAKVPAYIGAIKGKTAFLRECQAELTTPESALNAALAQKVADCAVAKLESAPVEQEQVATTAPAQIRTPETKTELPAAPQVAVAAQKPANSSLSWGVTVGGGAGAGLILGLIALRVFRKKKPEVAENPAPAASAVAKPAAPQPAKKTNIDL